MTTLTPAEKIAIDITVAFEGTGYTSLVGNFDDQGFTFGLVGFCLGQGSLQALITAFYKADPALFRRCCTVHVEAFGKVSDISGTLLDVSKMTPKAAVAWSLKRQENNVPVAHWTRVFENLGKEETFRAVQRAQLKPRLDLAWKYCVQFNVKTARGLALFFDTCVQQGSLKAATLTKAKKLGIDKASYSKKLEILALAVSGQALPQWRSDVFSRRMCIVKGYGPVHGKNWNIDAEFGLSDDPITPPPSPSKLSRIVKSGVQKLLSLKKGIK